MSDQITTPEALDALPPDDARTAWERKALDRFLRSSPDIPPHIFKNFEVALWGACHVLLLMRPDLPGAPADDLRAEIEAMRGDLGDWSDEVAGGVAYPTPVEQVASSTLENVVARLDALLAAHPVQVTTAEELDDLAADVDLIDPMHTIYEATDSEPAECMDECPGCAADRIRVALGIVVSDRPEVTP